MAFVREPNTLYVASLSYGKDSIAMLEAIKQLGYPLDAIVHAEVWATDTIPADLPPMVNFKEYADKKIKEMYGIDVLHTCAMRERVTNQDSAHCLNEEQETSNTKASVLDSHCKDTLGATPTSKQIIYEKRTYEKLFYHIPKRKNGGGGGTRIPIHHKTTMPIRPQDSSVSNRPIVSASQYKQMPAIRNSNEMPYRFPISTRRGNWCTQLKQQGFPKPPLHKAAK